MAESPRKPVDTDADEELVAYLDGELDPREAATMATRIGLDPKLRAKADALQRAWDILDVLPKPQPSPTFVAHPVTQILPGWESMSLLCFNRLKRSGPALQKL